MSETITSVYGCSLLDIPEPPGYRIMLKFRPPKAGISIAWQAYGLTGTIMRRGLIVGKVEIGRMRL